MTMQNYDGRTALHVAAAQGIEGKEYNFQVEQIFIDFFSSLVR